MTLSDTFVTQMLLAIAVGQSVATTIMPDALPPAMRTALQGWLSDNNIPDDRQTDRTTYVFSLPRTGFDKLYVADYSGDEGEGFRGTAVFYENKFVCESLQTGD